MRFTVVELDLRSVTFGAVASDMYHAVTNDDGVTTYAARQFQDLSPGDAPDPTKIQKNPISFTRGATATADAEIRMRTVVQGVDATNLVLRGQGFRADGGQRTAISSFDFMAAAVLGPAGDYINFKVEPSKALAALADEVDAIKNLEIVWTVSFDGGNSWIDAGKSVNPVYVTYADPTFSFINTKLLWTILDIGVVAADGLQGPQEPTTAVAEKAADLVWNAFKNRDVKAIDGRALLYYGTWDYDSVRTNAVDLVKPGQTVGDCVAFATLFEYALEDLGFGAFTEAVGVAPNPAYTIKDPADQNTAIFTPSLLLLGDYVFAAANPPGPVARIPGLFINTTVGAFQDSAAKAYKWTVVEEADENGLAALKGQGDTKPPIHFGGHQVVRVGDVVYDPSYGEARTWRGLVGRFEITDPTLGIQQYLVHFQNVQLGGLAAVRGATVDGKAYSNWDVLPATTVSTNDPPRPLMVVRSY